MASSSALPFLRRTMLLLAVMIGVGLGGSLAFMLCGGRIIVTSHIRQQMLNSALMLKSSLQREFDNHLLFLNGLGTSYQRARDVEASLLSYQASCPLIKRAFIINDKGTLESCLPWQQKLVSINFSKEPYFSLPLNERKASIQVTPLTPLFDGPSIIVSVPLEMPASDTSSKSRRAVLGIVIAAADFFNDYDDVLISGRSGFFALSPTDMIVGVPELLDDAVQACIRHYAEDFTAETTVQFQTCEDGRGQTIDVSLIRDNATGLLIGNAIARTDLMGHYRSITIRAVIASLLLFTVIMVGGWMHVRPFDRKLQAIVARFRESSGAAMTLDDTNPRFSDTTDELDELLQHHATLVQSQRRGRHQLEHAYRQISTNELMKRDVSIAQQIQQAMIPTSFPHFADLEVAGSYEPAREVGGDLLDCFTHDDGRMSLLIADVSGKGIPAALVMAQTKILFRILAADERSTISIMEKANTFLHQVLRKNTFVTAIYAQYDRASRTLRYCNAGHDPALYYRHKQGDIIELTEEESTCLGAWSQFVGEEHSLILSPGDSLFFFTDGATEATRTDGEMFEIIRLRRAFETYHPLPARQTLEKIRESIGLFLQDAVQYDDLTLIVMKIPLTTNEAGT